MAKFSWCHHVWHDGEADRLHDGADHVCGEFAGHYPGTAHRCDICGTVKR